MGFSVPNLRWRRTADQWGPKRLVCLSLARSETRAVALSRQGATIRWDGSAQLPPFDPDSRGEEVAKAFATCGLRADYCSVVCQLKGTFVRLISFPGQPGGHDALLQQVRQSLGVDETFNVVLQQISDGREEKKGEYSLIACAMPVMLAKSIQGLLVDLHMEPVSLALGGVSIANLVQFAARGAGGQGTIGYLHIGIDVSHLLVFRESELAVIREFQFGESTIFKSLMKNMDLDEETARKLYTSESFDIGNEIVPALGPWMHQIGISLDFCERRYGSRVQELRVLGSGSSSPAVESAVHNGVARPVVAWKPTAELDGVQVHSDAANSPHEYLVPLGEGLRIISRGGSSSEEPEEENEEGAEDAV